MEATARQEFLEFCQARTTALFRVAYAIAGDQHGAEDLLQTALERLARRWRQIDEPEAYARRIMANESVSLWRRLRRRETLTPYLPDRADRVDETGTVDLRTALRTALLRLGPRQRAVLVLRYVGDLSEREVAEILGCSPSTVASQASRALARIRALCPDAGHHRPRGLNDQRGGTAMTEPEEMIQRAVREAVRDLAAEGHPVNLGQRALRRLRLRRVAAAAATGALVLTTVVALVALWPRGQQPPVPGPPPPVGSDAPWPTFKGLGTVPGPVAAEQTPEQTPEAASRLVMSAYLTPDSRLHLLDPTTGHYWPGPTALLMAVSPDLRYALVGPIDPVQDPSRPLPYEIGFYDAVKREVLGGVDLTPYTDSDQFAAWGAAWSADGRTVAIALREGLHNGGGWLVRTVVLVEVETGEVRAAAVPPANQLEPFALSGWSNDGTRLIFEADRVGTDMVPSGHLLVDPARGTSVGVTWPTQGSLARAVTGDEVAVLTAAADEIIVLNALTGQVLHRGAMSKDDINDALWRDGEIVFVDSDCAGQPTVCAETTVIGRNPATGTSRVIRRLGVSAVWAWLPPAAGAALPAGLSF